MVHTPFSVRITFLFLILSAVVWLVFTVLAAAGSLPRLPEEGAVRWVMAALAFGCACALIALILLLRKRIRIAFYLMLGLLLLLAVLTIADEVGLADWIYLVIVAAPLLLLIKDRTWYLRKASAAAANDKVR